MNLPALPPDPFEPTNDATFILGEANALIMSLSSALKEGIDTGDYYDRHGIPINLAQWSALRHADIPEYPHGYMRVASTRLTGIDKTDGLTRTLDISTVWLGIDHNYYDTGAPIIFETMVFEHDRTGMDELAMARYTTEEEAETGHTAMVEKLITDIYDPDEPITTEDTAAEE